MNSVMTKNSTDSMAIIRWKQRTSLMESVSSSVKLLEHFFALK